MPLTCADIDLIQGVALLLLALAIVPRLAAKVASHERNLWLLGLHGVSRGMSFMVAAGELGDLWGFCQPAALLLKAVAAYALCMFGLRTLGPETRLLRRVALVLFCILILCILACMPGGAPVSVLLFLSDWLLAIPGAVLSAFAFLRLFVASRGIKPRPCCYLAALLVIGLSFLLMVIVVSRQYVPGVAGGGGETWQQLVSQRPCDWVGTLCLVIISGGLSFLLRHLSEEAYQREQAANRALAARSLELGALNDTLESRVRERTEALERSHDELVASNARLQALFDQDAVGIAFLDKEGRYVRVNQRLASLLGRSQEEVVSLGFGDITDPDFITEDRKLWQAVLSGRRRSFLREKRYVRPDGQVVWASVRVAAVRSDAGEIRHLVGIYEDIQENRRIADVLRENERRLQLALAASHQNLFEYDVVAGRFTFSEDFLENLGWSSSVFPSEFERWTEFLHSEDRAQVRSAFSACARGAPASISLEYRQRAANGLWRWILMRGSVVSHEQPGTSLRILGTLMDCTDRRQFDERLRRTQRLESIGTLAGGIAHDLNNALVPLLAGVAFLRDYVPEGDTELVTAMDTSARRAAGMVQHLLAFARGAEGRRAPVSPGVLAEEMQRFVTSTFPHNIQFHCMCLCPEAVITGDSTQLHQVLLNLCVNARDAMPDGGALTLEMSLVEVDAVLASEHVGVKPGEYVLFQVTDSGMGIPAAIRERIFDPFFSTKGLDKGTGLGLSTVLGIVRGHNGFITLQSEEGQGASFKVYLPRAEEGLLQPKFLPGAVPALEGKGRCILVAEDQAIVQQMIRRVLERAGFKLVLASDGVEALAWLGARPEPIDLLLADLNMPNMGAVDLMQALRARGIAIPTVVMSGNFTREEQVRLRELGTLALVPKPFDGQDLLSVLLRALDGASASAT